MSETPSGYIILEFPCYVELRASLETQLEKIEDAFVLSERAAIGKMIMNLLRGKRERTGVVKIKNQYPETVKFAIPEAVGMSVGTHLSASSIRDINVLEKENVRLMLYRHLQLSLRADPSFHIHNGIVRWMEMMGIPEDGKTLDNYKRNFTNWRMVKCPELMRAVGRPSSKGTE